MAAASLQVEIVSAEREIFSGQAAMVFAPAIMGEVGIAPRHAPLVTRLRAGEVRVQDENGAEEAFFVSGGILEVQPHVVTILSDTALRSHDIDEAAAMEAMRRAEETLADKSAQIDYARAQAELMEAAAQLRAIQRLRKK